MPISEARKKANIEYNRRQDSITIRPTKDEGAKIREAAKVAGLSVQKYILETLRDRMERESRDPVETKEKVASPGAAESRES